MKKGSLGSSTNLMPKFSTLIKSLQVAHKYRKGQYKRHRMGYGHKRNVQDFVRRGLGDHEVWFVLMDYERSEKLKWKAMSHREAYQRNEVLRGTGFAWAKCQKP